MLDRYISFSVSLIHQVSDKRQLGKCGNGKVAQLKLEDFNPIARLAHRKSRSLSKTYWKVKVHSVIERKIPEVLLRLSRQAGVKRVSTSITRLRNQNKGKPETEIPEKVGLKKATSARKKLKRTERHSVRENSSGKLSGNRNGAPQKAQQEGMGLGSSAMMGAGRPK